MRPALRVSPPPVLPGIASHHALRELLGGDLRPHQAHGRRRRADKDDSSLLACFREGGILGEKTIAGMDSLGPAAPGDIENGLARQIALRGGSGADRVSFVSETHMPGVAVSFGIHGYRAYAHLAAGRHDTDGYLSPVRNHYFLKHKLRFYRLA